MTRRIISPHQHYIVYYNAVQDVEVLFHVFSMQSGHWIMRVLASRVQNTELGISMVEMVILLGP
jgi:hypothetical protein